MKLLFVMPFRSPAGIEVAVNAAGLFHANENEFLIDFKIAIHTKIDHRTDMDVVLHIMVVAATMVMVVGNKLATADFVHGTDDSVADPTYFLLALFTFSEMWDTSLLSPNGFLLCFIVFVSKTIQVAIRYSDAHCQTHLLRIYERTVMKRHTK